MHCTSILASLMALSFTAHAASTTAATAAAATSTPCSPRPITIPLSHQSLINPSRYSRQHKHDPPLRLPGGFLHLHARAQHLRRQRRRDRRAPRRRPRWHHRADRCGGLGRLGGRIGHQQRSARWRSQPVGCVRVRRWCRSGCGNDAMRCREVDG